MAGFAGPNLTTDKLVLCLDAGDSNSYSGSGTTWNDVSGFDIHGTINSATYTSDADGKYFAFDGTDDYISFAMGGGDPDPLKLATWSTECWFKQASGGSTSNTGAGGLLYYPLVTKGRGEADGNNRDTSLLLETYRPIVRKYLECIENEYGTFKKFLTNKLAVSNQDQKL